MMTTTRNAAAAREPTVVELEKHGSLRDILTWAAVRGDPSVAYSQAGSLLHLLAGDEFTSMHAEEFAFITPDDFEDALSSWMFSAYDADYGHGAPELTEKPLPQIKARARAARRAARLWKHLGRSSQAVTAYKQCQDEEAVKVKGASTVQQTIAAAPSGDMVLMHETADVTKVREVPMMGKPEWGKGLGLFKRLMMRAPFPAEKPSLA